MASVLRGWLQSGLPVPAQEQDSGMKKDGIHCRPGCFSRPDLKGKWMLFLFQTDGGNLK